MCQTSYDMTVLFTLKTVWWRKFVKFLDFFFCVCVVDKYIKLNLKTSFVIIYRFKQHLLNYSKVWGTLFILGENLT